MPDKVYPLGWDKETELKSRMLIFNEEEAVSPRDEAKRFLIDKIKEKGNQKVFAIPPGTFRKCFFRRVKSRAYSHLTLESLLTAVDYIYDIKLKQVFDQKLADELPISVYQSFFKASSEDYMDYSSQFSTDALTAAYEALILLEKGESRCFLAGDLLKKINESFIKAIKDRN